MDALVYLLFESSTAAKEPPANQAGTGKAAARAIAELSLQILELAKSRGQITISEVVTLTKANRNTVKKHLETLVADKHLQRHGSGRGVLVFGIVASNARQCQKQYNVGVFH